MSGLSLEIIKCELISAWNGEIFPNLNISCFLIKKMKILKNALKHQFESWVDANFWAPSTFTTLNHVILWIYLISNQLKLEFNWIVCNRLDLWTHKIHKAKCNLSFNLWKAFELTRFSNSGNKRFGQPIGLFLMTNWNNRTMLKWNIGRCFFSFVDTPNQNKQK